MAKQSDVEDSDLELQPTTTRSLGISRSNPVPATETNVNAVGSSPAGKYGFNLFYLC